MVVCRKPDSFREKQQICIRTKKKNNNNNNKEGEELEENELKLFE